MLEFISVLEVLAVDVWLYFRTCLGTGLSRMILLVDKHWESYLRIDHWMLRYIGVSKVF